MCSKHQEGDFIPYAFMCVVPSLQDCTVFLRVFPVFLCEIWGDYLRMNTQIQNLGSYSEVAEQVPFGGIFMRHT